MSKSPPTVAQASVTYARSLRHPGKVPPEQVAAYRTDLEEAKVREWVERTLATAPPHLTPETQARLARLLAAGEAS